MLRLVGRIVIIVAVVPVMGAVSAVATSANRGRWLEVIINHNLRGAAC